MNFSCANERRKKREETIGLSLVIQLAVLDYPNGKDTKFFETTNYLLTIAKNQRKNVQDNQTGRSHIHLRQEGFAYDDTENRPCIGSHSTCAKILAQRQSYEPADKRGRDHR
jgi:hypothetical protein